MINCLVKCFVVANVGIIFSPRKKMGKNLLQWAVKAWKTPHFTMRRLHFPLVGTSF